jgi:hypothetical protein
MIFTREERLPFQHLSEDTASAPNINFNVIFLPSKHDLWSTVISGRHVSRHLRVLNPGQAEVADFEIAVFIDKDIAGFQVSMNDTCRMDVLQTALYMIGLANRSTTPGGSSYQDLIEEILNELFLQRPRG